VGETGCRAASDRFFIRRGKSSDRDSRRRTRSGFTIDPANTANNRDEHNKHKRHKHAPTILCLWFNIGGPMAIIGEYAYCENLHRSLWP
jgi:hypothetical protein